MATTSASPTASAVRWPQVPQEHLQAGLLDHSAHRRAVSGADDQIALPMPGHNPVRWPRPVAGRSSSSSPGHRDGKRPSGGVACRGVARSADPGQVPAQPT
jgi:hypothetical protein